MSGRTTRTDDWASDDCTTVERPAIPVIVGATDTFTWTGGGLRLGVCDD